MNGVYKTNIDCSFIRRMVENYCTLGKFNLSLLFTSALRASVNSGPRLNFTLETIIFHHSPHAQSILYTKSHCYSLVVWAKSVTTNLTYCKIFENFMGSYLMCTCFLTLKGATKASLLIPWQWFACMLSKFNGFNCNTLGWKTVPFISK